MFIIDHLKFFDLLSRIVVGVVVLALFPLFNGEVIKDAFYSPSVFTVLRRWMHSERCCYNKRPIIKGLNLHQQT